MQGGGQSDTWHTLHCKGKYAGEIRIELTYYDTRPKVEKSSAKEENPDLHNQRQPQSRSEQRCIEAPRRRPLPAGPSNMKRPLSHSTIQSPMRNRGIENERYHIIHTNSEFTKEDPRLKYHYSWNSDMSQGSTSMDDKRTEPLRHQHLEPHRPENSHVEKQYSINQRSSQEEPIYDHPLPEEVHNSSEYTSYESHRFGEQPANFSTMRSRTEPISTLHANAWPQNRSVARPEHSMNLEGDISGIRNRPLSLIHQDEIEASILSASHIEDPVTLSNGPASSLPYSTSIHPGKVLPHEFNNVQNLYREEENEQIIRGSHREFDNTPSAYACDPLHQPRGYIQPEETYPQANNELVFGVENEVPPPPPLHRTALHDSKKIPSRHLEDAMVAPVPLRHMRQEVANRHSYPNYLPMSYETAKYEDSQEEVKHPSFQPNQPAIAHLDPKSDQGLYDFNNQKQYRQEHHLRLSQTSLPNEVGDEENLHSYSNDRGYQRASISKRPLSLSIGGYQYQEDMHHSQSSQPANNYLGDVEPRKSITQADLANHSQTAHGDWTSYSAQTRNSREITPFINPRTSPDGRYARSSNRSTPTRKSVSPQPLRPKATSPGMSSSGIPFSPDSYENSLPSQSVITQGPVAHGSAQPYARSQGAIDSAPGAAAATAAATTMAPMLEDTINGPIIGPDGRVIDPSDHLPVDSWAPEPERKNPHKPAPIRIRVSPRGAQPMPSNAKRENATRITAYSASPLSASTSSESHAPSDRASDARGSGSGRARLQKRPPGGWGSAGQHDGLVGATEGLGAASPHGALGGAVPPIPAKIPVNAGAGDDDMMALSEEMKSIDIGTGFGRSVGRASRGRYG